MANSKTRKVSAASRKACEAGVVKAMKRAIPKAGTRKYGVRLTQSAINKAKNIVAGVEKNAIAMCGMTPEQKK